MFKNKIAIATFVAIVLASLTAISISPPAIAAKHAMIDAMANHAVVSIVIVAVIGFLGTLYLYNE